VSLPAPIIVGKSESALSASVQKDVRDALRLVRATPAFMRAQRSSNNASGDQPVALEEHVLPRWTRFSWNGERRAYLAIVSECAPPLVDLGFDFRETATGSLEVRPGRSLERPSGYGGITEAVDPVVVVDVDADGRLEVIEATEIFYRLRSFDGTEHYVLHTMDHCR